MRSQLFDIKAFKAYQGYGYLKGEDGFALALLIFADYSPLVTLDEDDYYLRGLFGEGWREHLAKAIESGLLLDNTGVKDAYIIAPFFPMNEETTAFRCSIELKRIAKAGRFFVDYETCVITRDKAKGGPLADFLPIVEKWVEKANKEKTKLRKQKKPLIKPIERAIEEWVLKRGEEDGEGEERNKRISERSGESEGESRSEGKSEIVNGTLPVELNKKKDTPNDSPIAPPPMELSPQQKIFLDNWKWCKGKPNRDQIIRDTYGNENNGVLLYDYYPLLEREEDKQAYLKIFPNLFSDESDKQ